MMDMCNFILMRNALIYFINLSYLQNTGGDGLNIEDGVSHFIRPALHQRGITRAFIGFFFHFKMHKLILKNVNNNNHPSPQKKREKKQQQQ